MLKSRHHPSRASLLIEHTRIGLLVDAAMLKGAEAQGPTLKSNGNFAPYHLHEQHIDTRPSGGKNGVGFPVQVRFSEVAIDVEK
jgi:hypothetical protein